MDNCKKLTLLVGRFEKRMLSANFKFYKLTFIKYLMHIEIKFTIKSNNIYGYLFLKYTTNL